MNIAHIGFSYSVSAGFGALRKFEEGLDHLRSLGYTMVEINPQPFAIIMDGQIRAQQLADFVAVLRNIDLRYSIHGYNRLNLAYDPRHELCQRIMRCQIEICRAVGADRLVYHSGLQALDDLYRGVRHTPLSDQELAEGAQREVAAFRVLGPVAADAGVVIGMENGDSHLWEHTLMTRFGLPREELLKHHARLQIAPIVRQLEAIDHPSVGMTLDIAHLHIAAHDMGFDYLAAVTEAAPWVVHLHANDNFGRLDTGFDSEPERWPYGEADIHLPPGWGSIPYAEVFARLPQYHGDLILEIKEGFADYLAESLATTRRLVSGN